MGDQTESAYRDDRRRALGLAAARCPEMVEQKRQIARVSERIEGAILEYFTEHGPGHQFHADELREFVVARMERHGIRVAPDSARRIASSMKPHAINFVCINRAQSRYRIIPKGET